jgi:hypothetical protein
LVVGLLAAIGWRPIRDDYVGTEPPDVTLRLVYPKHPALELQNMSNRIAREIKYSVGLWNIDKPTDKNPLPIPTSVFDFLRPHSVGGPQAIFQHVGSKLQSGTRLFGSISVVCSECVRGRTYLVYITWGQGGWFYEVPGLTAGNLMWPVNFESRNIDAIAVEAMAAIPEDRRIPIAERAPGIPWDIVQGRPAQKNK